MKRTWLAVAIVLGLFGGQALAQAPGGEEEEFDVKKAMEEVARLLKESEKLLVESISPRETDSPEEAAERAEEVAKAIEKLLKQSQESGAAAADKMKEILEKAPQSGGGGGSGEQEQPSEGEDAKRKEQEKNVDERDPMNSGEQDQPTNGEENEKEPDSAAKTPESETEKPPEPDPNEEWLRRLPEKIRLAYKNGEWNRIPEKYRRLIEAYTKRMAEIESDR